MPINKFGLFEPRNDATGTSGSWDRFVKSYVHENALCRVVTDYDARSRKIRRVAQPEADTDAVNKLYVESCVKRLMNRQKESDEKLTSFEKDVRAIQIVLDKLQRAANANSETAINLNEQQ